MTINAFIGWFGITAYPLCCFYSSYLQQKGDRSQVSALVDQFTSPRTLKKYGTWSFYPTTKRINDGVTSVKFAYASHTKNSSQLYYILGIFYDVIQ